MITIEQASNGYIVRDTSDPDADPTVVEVPDEMSVARGFQHLALLLQEMLGRLGSRHDAERCYIEIRPGDKYSDRCEEA